MTNISYFFSIIYLSFFSKSFYRQVAFSWQSIGLKWLTLTLLLYSLILSLNNILSFNNLNFEQKDSYINSIIMQIPDIKINNGLASSEVAQPYFIRDNRNQDILIIDTTGKIYDLNYSNAFLLLTKTYIYFKSIGKEKKKISLAKLLPNKNIIVNPENVINFLNYIKSKIIFFMILVFVPIFIVICLVKESIRILLYSFVASVMFRLLQGKSIPSKVLFRLGAISTIPIIITKTGIFLSFPNLSIGAKSLIGFVINISYYYFAVTSAFNKEK
ncbi:MAG: hypothetical protein ACK4OM_03120 [Alphaproteobacteria bacterium]